MNDLSVRSYHFVVAAKTDQKFVAMYLKCKIMAMQDKGRGGNFSIS